MRFLKKKNKILVGLFVFLIIFYYFNLNYVFAEPLDRPPPNQPQPNPQPNPEEKSPWLVQKAKDAGNFISSFFGIDNIFSKVIAKVAFVINYIISIIAGVFINFEAWLIDVVLQINTQILKSEFVQAGYQISLATVNLIFVGGIIFIAIATILRWEQYSIKKILWKLILMAVLVNFGLSIAGAIIRFSDDLSQFFLSAISPGGGNNDSQYGAFATAIAGSFTPQRFFVTNVGGDVTTSTNLGSNDEKQLAGMFGGNLAKLITPIVSIFFTIIFLAVIIITLGALIIMLIYRYVHISILLMILPLAWALWIFPHSENRWKEWWNNFLRWTFFAPAVLFFLYLCLLTLRATPGGGNTPYKIQGVSIIFRTQGNTIIGGLESFGASFITGLLVPILNVIVMTGCVLGGLKISQRLGIEGADKALKIAEVVSKSAGMFAANRAAGLGAAGLTKILPKTPPPSDKGGLRRALHTVGFKTQQLSERFGVAQKLEETSKKYGPSAWRQKREKAETIKREIGNINNEIANKMANITSKKQNELDALKKNLEEMESAWTPQIQKQEDVVSALNYRLEHEMDLSQRSQIQKNLEAERQKLEQIRSQRQIEVDRINNQIKQKERELKLPLIQQPEIQELIKQRREKYKEIGELKPEGIFKTMIDAGMETYKPKKKKIKAPKEKIEKMSEEAKEQIEDLGIELEAEETKKKTATK